MRLPLGVNFAPKGGKRRCSGGPVRHGAEGARDDESVQLWPSLFPLLLRSQVTTSDRYEEKIQHSAAARYRPGVMEHRPDYMTARLPKICRGCAVCRMVLRPIRTGYCTLGFGPASGATDKAAIEHSGDLRTRENMTAELRIARSRLFACENKR
jgi:hypothetical protein